MITRLTIHKAERFADGHTFGEGLMYETLEGRAYGEILPADPLNRCIVNLEHAPSNARGRIEYCCDVHILKPVDMKRGNRRMLYEAPNRGSKRALMFFNDAPSSNNPHRLEHAGNGFLMRRGFTWVTSGWQGDLLAGNHTMTMEVPVAAWPDRPIIERTRTEICVRDPGVFSQPLSGDARVRSYKTATQDPSHCSLTVRKRGYDRRTPVPAVDWGFARCEMEPGTGLPRAVSSDEDLFLTGGFVPGSIYELVYPAKDPLVLGLGFAAVRDLVSFLRYQEADPWGTRNPLASPHEPLHVEKAYAWGRSQSGRFLRDFVYHGFNEDESHRRVFDAIFPHASGGGRIFLNYEFARPVTSSQQHNNQLDPELFPFAYNQMTDPQTGRRDGILKRPATDPLVLHTQTATEYWQKRGALVHTEGAGKDIDCPDTVRIYSIAGAQHNTPYGDKARKQKTLHLTNPMTIGPVLRALLVAMDRWATEGVPPPPSLVPRVSDGTLVAPDQKNTGFPSLPGTRYTGLHNRQLFLDYGPQLAQGRINLHPPEPLNQEAYCILVPRVDHDGNEIAGIRQPWIRVPLGTYTGWNFQSEALAEGDLASLLGSYIPFPTTTAERQKAQDPRPAIEERYGGLEDYLTKFRAAMETMAGEGFLLEEDRDTIISDARQAFLKIVHGHRRPPTGNR